MTIFGVPFTVVDFIVVVGLISVCLWLLSMILINYLNTHLPGPPGHAEWVDESLDWCNIKNDQQPQQTLIPFIGDDDDHRY